MRPVSAGPIAERSGRNAEHYCKAANRRAARHVARSLSRASVRRRIPDDERRGRMRPGSSAHSCMANRKVANRLLTALAGQDRIGADDGLAISEKHWEIPHSPDCTD